MQSLRTRLWLTSILLVILVLCIVGSGLFVFLLRNPTPTRTLYMRLQSAVLILSQAGQLPAEQGAARLQAAAARTDENYAARITIFNASEQGNLTVLADSRPTLGDAPIPQERMLQSESSQLPGTYRDSNGDVWIYAARRLANGLVVMASAPRPDVNWRTILREEFLSPLMQAGLVAFLAASLLALWIAHWIAKPLQQLAQAAHELQVSTSPKEKAATIKIKGPAEVHEVAEAFNAMSQRVQASQQSQRDFVANVSHDLKTPLTAIQGFAQAILDGTARAPADLEQAARIIHGEAERMSRMVQDLLELARLDSGIAQLMIELLDLRPILEQVVEQFSLQIQRSQIRVVLNMPVLPPIQGDRDRLARLFANLLDNALKHTPPGETIHIQAHTNPDSMEVFFIDRGPGLPEGASERVFERFYQTDKSRSGLQRGVGLGLSIAREIVLAHGGTIRAYNNAPTTLERGRVVYNKDTAASLPSPIQSQEGSMETIGSVTGATFVVKLPIVQPAQAFHQTRPEGRL